MGGLAFFHKQIELKYHLWSLTVTLRCYMKNAFLLLFLLCKTSFSYAMESSFSTDKRDFSAMGSCTSIVEMQKAEIADLKAENVYTAIALLFACRADAIASGNESVRRLGLSNIGPVPINVLQDVLQETSGSYVDDSNLPRVYAAINKAIDWCVNENGGILPPEFGLNIQLNQLVAPYENALVLAPGVNPMRMR
jgi:hypothetical protein